MSLLSLSTPAYKKKISPQRKIKTFSRTDAFSHLPLPSFYATEPNQGAPFYMANNDCLYSLVVTIAVNKIELWKMYKYLLTDTGVIKLVHISCIISIFRGRNQMTLRSISYKQGIPSWTTTLIRSFYICANVAARAH